MKKRLLLLLGLSVCLTVPVFMSFGSGTEKNDEVSPYPVSARAGDDLNRPELSNLHVNDFCQDSLGYLWIATSRGLNRYNGYGYVHYFHEKNNPLSIPNDHVTSLFMDSRRTLWIGTLTGAARYDSRTGRFTRVEIEGDPQPRYVFEFAEDPDGNIWIGMQDGVAVIPPGSTVSGKRMIDYARMDFKWGNLKTVRFCDNGILWIALEHAVMKYHTQTGFYDVLWENAERTVSDILPDRERIWVATDRGLRWVDKETGQEIPLPPVFGSHPALERQDINRIETFDSHSVWLATDHDLYRYDRQGDSISPVDHRKIYPQIEFQKITAFYNDCHGNLWIGTFNKGLTVRYPDRKEFNPDETLSALFRDLFVTAVCEQPGTDYLWIGTRYDGLFRYDRKTRRHIRYDPANSPVFSPVANAFVQSLFCDSSGQLWVGLTNGAAILHLSAQGMTGCTHLENLGGVVSLMEDGMGRMWLGTEHTGLYVYVCTEGRLVRVFEERAKNVTTILPLSSGKMLVSFHAENIYLFDPVTFRREFLLEEDPQLKPILRSCITCKEVVPGELWIGSYNGGAVRLDLSGRGYTLYDRDNGLPSNDVLGIAPAPNGDVWLSTSYGISKYDRASSLFHNFYTTDGIRGNQFHEKACIRTGDGMIFMGGNHGLTFFEPERIRLDTVKPAIVLEELRILNHRVDPGGTDGVLERSLPYTTHITLNHRQNVFTIDYAALGFSRHQKYRYASRLDGLDPDWNEVGEHRRASYMNLKPGNYTFRVRVRNEAGIWNEEAAALNIRVKAAPWFSGWAFGGYALLVVSLLYVFLRLWMSGKINKISLEALRKDNQRDQELSRMKISFYHNISHELKTPLSLIYGPLKVLLKQNHRSQEQHLLHIMEMNVNRLMKLIHQLLDFSKMESDALELAVREEDPVALVREIKDRFDYHAEQKRISFGLYSEKPGYMLCLDRDKLDKIMNNLLSNAFKYTPPGGSVDIHIRQATAEEVAARYTDASGPAGTYLEVSVRDTGVGVSPEDIPYLFQKYKRLKSVQGEGEIYEGTGLGLSFTKNLVTLHKGYIRACAGEPGGMVFSFALPMDRTVYGKPSPERTTSFLPREELPPVHLTPVREPEGEEPSSSYTVLLVEDDPGLQDFIRCLLSPRYNFLQAFEASEGFRILQQKMPDIVITDVLMPGMNGYQFCRKIKTNLELSHTPVVILTAKGETEEHIQGLNSGADAYIGKPFDDAYLLAVVSNLLANRERLKGILPAGFVPEDEPISAIDRKLMEKLYSLLDQQLDEVETNVDQIARELGFSRSSFYRKIKMLTGESPNTFIRTYRLNKARMLILKGEMTISEVATFTGFSTLSHFSVCFKKLFGISPTECKAQRKN